MTPNTTARPASARRARRRWSSAAVVVIVVAAGITYWRKVSAAPPADYVTAEVTRGPVTPSVTASGTLNPVITVQVGSYVSGVIQSLFCDYNTTVKKGQLCARIDPRPFSIVVDQDQADLDTARAQLDKDQASLKYATLSFERGTALLNSGLDSKDTLDSLQSAESQGKAQVEVDQATVEQKQASLDAAKINLGYTNIISPVNGTVVSRNVTVGQTVAASFQTPTLFLIANDLTKMQVDTNVSEGDIGGLRAGDAATFTVDAFPGRPFKGHVAQVRQAPQSVQNVITYDVVIDVANPDLLLMPGMTAAVHIIVDQQADALRVPDRALRFTPAMAGARPTPGSRAAPSTSPTSPASMTGGASHPAAEAKGGTGVWVLRNGRAVHVPITVGLDDGTNAEVRSGALAAGDQVIVSEETTSAPVTRGGLRPFRP
jgi:HlyD family secretion protein